MLPLLKTYIPSHFTWQTIALAFLITFICGGLIAKTYERTYRGLSWSPALVQTLVLSGIVTCMVMMAIGDNIAGAIGIIGSLAIIRFRTNLRDPRDMVFVFAAIGTGVACGMLSFLPALIGTAVFCLVAFILHGSGFAARRTHDGLLRFQAPTDGAVRVTEVLHGHTAHFALVTLREVAQGRLVEYAYQVKLRRSGDSDDAERLLAALRGISGVEGLAYFNQQSTTEV